MKFKSLFCFILVCSFLLLGLAGCGSSSPTNEATSVDDETQTAQDNEPVTSDLAEDEPYQWINFDFSSPITLSAVHISFYDGDEDAIYFRFESSNDSKNWSTHLDTVNSTSNLEFETFNLDENVTARYFRLASLGTSNNNQTSIAEVTFSAANEQDTFAIPGLIEAEDYSAFYDSTAGNQGGEYRDDDVDIEQTSDITGNYNIDFINDGEWLAYPINVGSGGEYNAKLRVSSANGGGSIIIYVDDLEKGRLAVPATTQWETKNIQLGVLSSGEHTLKVLFTAGEFELNWIELSRATLKASTLDPNLPPSGNFDLSQWYLGAPIDDNADGKSDSISESQLAAGYEHPQWFYTADDGAMVFKVEIDAPKTSTNTSYSRSELREMLRAGDTNISTQGINKNNWVFSTYSSDDKNAAGGIDGELTATLKVDYVTTTGESSQVGRVIIGQIHAKDDEPARLYYRKLKDNSKGSIYLAHEPNGGNDQLYNMIGTSSSTAVDPVDGIELGEIFTYSIKVTGNTLLVTIMRDGKPDVTQSVDMSNSGYHTGDDQYMYFKAGVYNQNNTGDPSDYVQASFYRLFTSHN